MAQDRHAMPALPVVVMVVHMALAFGGLVVWIGGLVVQYVVGDNPTDDSIVASVMEMFGELIGTVTNLAGALFAVLFGLTFIWFFLLKKRVALGFRIAYTAHIGAEAAALLYPVPTLLEQDMDVVAILCVGMAVLLLASIAYTFLSRELKAYFPQKKERPPRPETAAPAPEAAAAEPEYTGPELP